GHICIGRLNLTYCASTWPTFVRWRLVENPYRRPPIKSHTRGRDLGGCHDVPTHPGRYARPIQIPLRRRAVRGSKQDLPVAYDGGAVVIRQADWSDLTVSIESFPQGLDTAPIFRGLPDDRCQCPHWGYVARGRVRMVYGDREEVLSAGDAY